MGFLGAAGGHDGCRAGLSRCPVQRPVPLAQPHERAGGARLHLRGRQASLVVRKSLWWFNE